MELEYDPYTAEPDEIASDLDDATNAVTQTLLKGPTLRDALAVHLQNYRAALAAASKDSNNRTVWVNNNLLSEIDALPAFRNYLPDIAIKTDVPYSAAHAKPAEVRPKLQVAASSIRQMLKQDLPVRHDAERHPVAVHLFHYNNALKRLGEEPNADTYDLATAINLRHPEATDNVVYEQGYASVHEIMPYFVGLSGALSKASEKFKGQSVFTTLVTMLGTMREDFLAALKKEEPKTNLLDDEKHPYFEKFVAATQVFNNLFVKPERTDTRGKKPPKGSSNVMPDTQWA